MIRGSGSVTDRFAAYGANTSARPGTGCRSGSTASARTSPPAGRRQNGIASATHRIGRWSFTVRRAWQATRPRARPAVQGRALEADDRNDGTRAVFVAGWRDVGWLRPLASWSTLGGNYTWVQPEAAERSRRGRLGFRTTSCSQRSSTSCSGPVNARLHVPRLNHRPAREVDFHREGAHAGFSHRHDRRVAQSASLGVHVHAVVHRPALLGELHAIGQLDEGPTSVLRLSERPVPALPDPPDVLQRLVRKRRYKAARPRTGRTFRPFHENGERSGRSPSVCSCIAHASTDAASASERASRCSISHRALACQKIGASGSPWWPSGRCRNAGSARRRS